MLDYDHEAATYDETRGGERRAVAAAEAVRSLFPTGTRTVLDLACGTGIVSRHLGPASLAETGPRAVFGADLSIGMLRLAAPRLGPSRVVVADATRLPFPAASFGAVTAVWLLHLAPAVPSIIAEVARVLRPGGVLVTTVDKNQAQFAGTDIGELVRRLRRPDAADDAGVIAGYAAKHGMEPAGTATFRGFGQGRSAKQAARMVRAGHGGWEKADNGPHVERLVDTIVSGLAALPGPDVVRPDPVYQVHAYRKLA